MSSNSCPTLETPHPPETVSCPDFKKLPEREAAASSSKRVLESKNHDLKIARAMASRVPLVRRFRSSLVVQRAEDFANLALRGEWRHGHGQELGLSDVEVGLDRADLSAPKRQPVRRRIQVIGQKPRVQLISRPDDHEIRAIGPENFSGTTAAVPGRPLRTTTTSPVWRADFLSSRWNSVDTNFRSVSSIRNGATFSERRKGIPSSRY